jgi:ankyrin repeat protein
MSDRQIQDAEVLLLAPPEASDAGDSSTLRLDLTAYFDIFISSELGLRDRVAKLLEARPELARARNREGKTAFMLAAQYDHSETMTLLLEHGADIEARDRLEATPLHRAAKMGRTSVIQFLLERGANPKAKDLWSKTPLERALAADHKDAARLLQGALIARKAVERAYRGRAGFSRN